MSRAWFLVLSLVLAGCPGEQDKGARSVDAPGDAPAPPATEPPPKTAEPLSTGKGGTSPNDVFERMRRAMKNGDWFAYHDLLTPESAVGTLPALTFLCGMACGAEEPLQKQFQALLDQHGLEGEADGAPAGPGGALALYEPVKDKRQLFVDLYSFFMKHKSRLGEMDELAGLEDVKIDGESAVGQLIYKTADGKLRRDVGEFRKVDDRWYAHLKMQ